MKIKIFTFLILLTFSSGFAQEQKMTDAEIKAFKAGVSAVSKTIKTLTSDFVQYKHMDFLAKDIETSGKMSLKSPSLLHWQYKSPYSYSILFKGGKVHINDEGRKSTVDAGNSKLFGKLNKLIAGSVSGDMFDDKEFQISYFRNKSQNITRFVPKDPTLKKYIKQIELTFDPKESMVTQVKLIESSDDFTRIVLKNRVINAKIDEAAFHN